MQKSIKSKERFDGSVMELLNDHEYFQIEYFQELMQSKLTRTSALTSLVAS
jgi:hypothetical protein